MMAQTLVETMPGVLTSATGMTIADLPFPRSDLALWASAAQVATSPYSAGGVPTGETGIDALSDLQNGQAYPAWSAQSWVLGQGGGGLPYARSRLGDANSRRGQRLPVGMVQNKAGVTLYGLARLTAAPGASGSCIIGSSNSAATTSPILNLGFDSARQPRIVARRTDVAENSAVAAVAPVELNKWVGMIGIVSWATDVVALEVVGEREASVPGTNPIGGTAGTNSGSHANQALGLGMVLAGNVTTAGSGTTLDATKFTGGDIAEIGIFTKAITGKQLAGLKSYLRDMAKLLNG